MSMRGGPLNPLFYRHHNFPFFGLITSLVTFFAQQLGHEAFEQAGNGEGPGGDPFGAAGFNPFQDIFRNADVSLWS